MKPFIPYEKKSKKEQRELDAAKRRDWGAIRPVTRKPDNPKAYNRKKHQRTTDDHGAGVLFILIG